VYPGPTYTPLDPDWNAFAQQTDGSVMVNHGILHRYRVGYRYLEMLGTRNRGGTRTHTTRNTELGMIGKHHFRFNTISGFPDRLRELVRIFTTRSQVDDGKVKKTMYKVRWRGYDRT